ncbi:gliotoxin/aspirochlorine biosynthesis gamma-glutamylcyclotransferase [Microdochium nivale]|nr:gliotoxin/aspirochlorine biosynthesis gamma-glutamylcyclotransferase [Microdochium nivale]
MEDIPGSVLAAEQVPLLVPTDVHSESHPAECSCRKIIFSAADRLALSPKRPTTSSSPSSPSAEPRLKIADIPITCPERLEQAAVTATTTSELTIADRKVDSSSTATTGPPVPKTYLYLAYGSNLAAETFLGRRGIRPISRINVSAPAFDLNFGLGGLPYWEPCFANVEPRRKIPEPPARPPLNPPRPPPFDPSPKPQSTPPTPSSSSFPSAGDEGVLLPPSHPRMGRPGTRACTASSMRSRPRTTRPLSRPKAAAPPTRTSSRRASRSRLTRTSPRPLRSRNSRGHSSRTRCTRRGCRFLPWSTAAMTLTGTRIAAKTGSRNTSAGSCSPSSGPSTTRSPRCGTSPYCATGPVKTTSPATTRHTWPTCTTTPSPRAHRRSAGTSTFWCGSHG